MSIPEWAKSEQSIDEAKSYLRQGNSVDFFELVSSSVLREHPNDIAAHCLELVQAIADGREAPGGSDAHNKKVEDNRYVREKNICEFLNEWILALLKERPKTDSDRVEFHKRYLESVIASGSDRNEGTLSEDKGKPQDSEGKSQTAENSAKLPQ
ncbi:antigen 2 [Trypanosoma rangeli]|uniref:Antigen 2 n=1 Tax=Trypanosoma rangeli TaxID=5698 RepID=A0A3R7MCC7_TRYRA|nr:antigen 2 [Trypanosoma rangeli]RNF12734.1 antigen 2 [Trypanosoma rangeli]|eukprot:RNF12734.1 antigen 2 [Trypanosoma rangeli]